MPFQDFDLIAGGSSGNDVIGSNLAHWIAAQRAIEPCAAARQREFLNLTPDVIDPQKDKCIALYRPDTSAIYLGPRLWAANRGGHGARSARRASTIELIRLTHSPVYRETWPN